MAEADRKPSSKLTRSIARFGITVVLLAVLGALLVLLAGHWSIPEPAGVAFVILTLAAALWISEAVPLFVTSFLILFLSTVWLAPVMAERALPVEKGMFLAPFFSDIILLFLGGFVLSAALHKYRLDEQMARFIIRKSGDSLPRLVLGIMAITAFLSMWLSNTATAAMMLALVLPIVKEMPEGAAARKAIILAVPFAANAGGLGTPIGSPPNAIAMQYLRDLGIAPTFGMWMRVGIPGAIVMVLLAWVILIVLFKARGKLGSIECERLSLSYTPGIGLVIVGTLVTVVGWTTGGYHGFSSGTVALIPLILFFGTGILNVRDLRAMSWDVLLVMGGGLCLGTAIGASGLAGWVVEKLPADALSLSAVMVVFGVLACVMSSVMSNTATANLIMPIILGMSIEPLSPVILGVAFSCSLAMALPISTPPNAMAFSSGEIKVVDLFRPGIIITIVGVVLTFTLGYWWWGFVGFF